MKIVILSDSVCLPRPKGSGNIPYEDTFPFILDQSLRQRLGENSPTLIERGRRQRIIDHVVREWDDEVTRKQAEVVIVQVGGSDCVPRVFLPREREVIDKIPFKGVRNRLLQLETRRRRALLMLMPQRTLVTLPRFRKQASAIVKKAKVSGVKVLIFVGIIPATEKMSYHLPGVGKNSDLYNEVLEAQSIHPGVLFFDVKKLVNESGGIDRFTSDGMHYSKLGHRIFAEALADFLLANAGFSAPIVAPGRTLE